MLGPDHQRHVEPHGVDEKLHPTISDRAFCSSVPRPTSRQQDCISYGEASCRTTAIMRSRDGNTKAALSERRRRKRRCRFRHTAPSVRTCETLCLRGAGLSASQSRNALHRRLSLGKAFAPDLVGTCCLSGACQSFLGAARRAWSRQDIGQARLTLCDSLDVRVVNALMLFPNNPQSLASVERRATCGSLMVANR